MSKIYTKILKIIYHYSTAMTSWSWQKLYGNRKEGHGYKREKTLHEELMEGYEYEKKLYEDEVE